MIYSLAPLPPSRQRSQGDRGSSLGNWKEAGSINRILRKSRGNRNGKRASKDGSSQNSRGTGEGN